MSERWQREDLELTVEPEPVRRASPPERSGCVIVAIAIALPLAVLIVIALAAAVLATPRSGQTTDPIDVSGTSSAAQSGAPRPTLDVIPAAGTRTSTLSSGNLPPLAGAPRFAGIATWYCGGGSPCTRGYGPRDLVAAIDTDLGFHHGDIVVVRAFGRAVTVEIVDVCACAGERLIDLSRAAFARLADPDLGVIPVTIELATSPTAPATDP